MLKEVVVGSEVAVDMWSRPPCMVVMVAVTAAAAGAAAEGDAETTGE